MMAEDDHRNFSSEKTIKVHDFIKYDIQGVAPDGKTAMNYQIVANEGFLYLHEPKLVQDNGNEPELNIKNKTPFFIAPASVPDKMRDGYTQHIDKNDRGCSTKFGLQQFDSYIIYEKQSQCSGSTNTKITNQLSKVIMTDERRPIFTPRRNKKKKKINPKAIKIKDKTDDGVNTTTSITCMDFENSDKLYSLLQNLINARQKEIKQQHWNCYISELRQKYDALGNVQSTCALHDQNNAFPNPYVSEEQNFPVQLKYSKNNIQVDQPCINGVDFINQTFQLEEPKEHKNSPEYYCYPASPQGRFILLQKQHKMKRINHCNYKNNLYIPANVVPEDNPLQMPYNPRGNEPFFNQNPYTNCRSTATEFTYDCCGYEKPEVYSDLPSEGTKFKYSYQNSNKCSRKCGGLCAEFNLAGVKVKTNTITQTEPMGPPKPPCYCSWVEETGKLIYPTPTSCRCDGMITKTVSNIQTNSTSCQYDTEDFNSGLNVYPMTNSCLCDGTKTVIEPSTKPASTSYQCASINIKTEPMTYPASAPCQCQSVNTKTDPSTLATSTSYQYDDFKTITNPNMQWKKNVNKNTSSHNLYNRYRSINKACQQCMADATYDGSNIPCTKKSDLKIKAIELKLDKLIKTINTLVIDAQPNQFVNDKSQRSVAVNYSITNASTSRRCSAPSGTINTNYTTYHNRINKNLSTTTNIIDTDCRFLNKRLNTDNLPISEANQLANNFIQMGALSRSMPTHTVSNVDIFLEEIHKSNKAKRDIEDIINGCSSKRDKTVDVPTRERSTGVTASLSTQRFNNSLTASVSSNEEKQSTTAVNTEPLGLLALMQVSTETIKQLLSYVPTLNNKLLIQTMSRECKNYKPSYVCNICGAEFGKSVDLSSHIQSHGFGKAKDCCVCRHVIDACSSHVSGGDKFACQYCGLKFARAYCRQLHEETCARHLGKKHEVPSGLVLLR